MPPKRGRSPARPLISPRWLAMTPTGMPSMQASPQIISRARSPWNSSSAPAVEHGAQELVHVVGHAVVARAAGRTASAGSRAGGSGARHAGIARAREHRDQVAQLGQAGGVVVDGVVGHAADRGVRAGAAERLGVDHLAGGALDQVRAAEPHERRALDHHDDVGERGQVRAAGDAGPHHGRELRHVQIAPHNGIIIEDAARPVLAGEDAALVGQVHAGRVHEVDDRECGSAWRSPGHGGSCGSSPATTSRP